MLVELASRLLAVLAAIAFTLVLTRREIPLIPKGRWTFVALFALGLGMCTIAGIRDGIGGSAASPPWLTAVNGIFGAAAVVLLVAVLLGFNWRVGVALLAAAVGGSWITALAFAITAGLPVAGTGIATLVIVLGCVTGLTWTPRARRTPALVR